MFWHNGLGFRSVEEDDLEQIRTLRNDPSTWVFLTSIGQISKLKQREWYQRINQDSSVAYYSLVEEYKDFPVSYEGDFLGIIRMDEIDIHNRSIRVGADIIPDKRGKGWGTKAFQAILRFCFDQLGVHRIWLCVLEDNTIALKLYKSAGFTEEGRYRQAIWRDGKFKNYIIMSILEDEYRGQNAL